MSNLFYYRHDFQSRNDIKILTLDSIYGHFVGYGMYHQALEVMGEFGGWIPIPMIPVFSRSLGISHSAGESFLRDCVKAGLFSLDCKGYHSPRFIAWMQESTAKSSKRSEAGKAGAEARWQKTDHVSKAEAELISEKPQKQPKVERSTQSQDVSPTDETKAIMAQIDALWAESEETCSRRKNRGRNLTNKQTLKLIADYGFDRLCLALPVFYTWKWNAPRDVISDYRSIRQDWVWEKIAKTQPVGQAKKPGYEQRAAAWDRKESERIARLRETLTADQFAKLNPKPEPYKGD